MDPRFKREGFNSCANAEQAIVCIEADILTFINTEPSQKQSISHDNTAQSTSLFAFIEKKNSNRVKSRKVDAIILRRQYLERETVPENSNPLKFWKVIYSSCDINLIDFF